MNRAEIEALKAYPKEGEDKTIWTATFGEIEIDKNAIERKVFKEGYEQAEKDLALTWEDMEMIDRIMADVVDERFDGPSTVEEDYTEVLNRYNKLKEEKKK